MCTSAHNAAMDASTWIALAALVISVVAAIAPFISRKLTQRHALVTGWFAITAGGSGMSDRLILRTAVRPRPETLRHRS